MSYLNLAIKGTSWSLVQLFVERLMQSVVFLIAATVLGPYEFGIASLLSAPAVILASTLQSGNQAIIQRSSINDEFLNSMFCLFVLLGVCSAVLLCASSMILFEWGIPSEQRAMVAVTSIAPIATALAVVSEGLLSRSFSYRVLAIRKSAGLIVGGIVCCWLAFAGFGAWSIIALIVTAPTISMIVSIVAAQWKPTALPTFGSMRAGLKFSFAVIGVSAVTQINIRSADLVVGLIATPTAAGVFRLSRTVLDLATSLFLNPINNILLPIFSRMAGERTRMVSTLWRSCVVTGLLASVPFVASAFSAPYIALMVFGERWPHLPETITLMLLALPCIAVTAPVQTFIVATGNPMIAFRNNVIQAVADILMIATGAYLGTYWAAALFSLRYLMTTITILILTQNRLIDIRAIDGIKAMYPSLLGLLVVFFLSIIFRFMQLDLHDLASCISATVLSLTIYLLLAALLFKHRIRMIMEVWTARRS